jgi:fructokinase
MGAYAGAVSQDRFGQLLWAESQDANLDPRFIQQLPKAPLVSMLYETDPPERLTLGQDSADLYFRPEGLPSGWLRALRWAHFSGAALAREPLGTRLVALAEGLKAEGKRISYAPNYRTLSLDSAYDERLEQMCRVADLIHVSEMELRALFRVGDYHSGLAQIAAWNPSAWVLLDQAGATASLFHGEGECRGRAPAVDVRDPIGVAEASLAALIDSVMHRPGAELKSHLTRALAAGAVAAAATGWRPPLPHLIDSLEAEVEIL